MTCKSIIFYILTATVTLASCRGNNAAVSLDNAKSIEMQYADFLTLQEGEGFVYAEIINPWDTTKTLHKYVLVPAGEQVPANLPEGDIVRTPLKNTVVYTSVHTALIDELGAYDAIKGECNAQYVKMGKVQTDMKSGKIKDLGSGTNPDFEGIIDLSPDAILLSPFENSGNYGRLGKIGVPIIECADYMETSPLGRAEWMRFYGLLFGKQEEADSIFAYVEKRYNDLKSIVTKAKTRPTVITDLKFGSSWYVSGGNSTVGNMLADAGADYIFKDEKASGSVPYSPEVVFDKGQHAEIWIIKYNQATDKTYDEIASEYNCYSQIDAFKNKNIYFCNTNYIPYYEEVPFHPDMLLKDYICIFHPELMPAKTEMRYYKKLRNEKEN